MSAPPRDSPVVDRWLTEPPPALAAQRGRWRRWRTAIVLVLVFGIGVAVLSLSVAGATPPAGALDPDNAGRHGARALAQVLRQQGVTVEVVRSIESLEDTPVDSATTLVVGDPGDLGPGAASRLADVAAPARRLVLLEPDSPELDDLGVPLQVQDATTSVLDARCTSAVADTGDRLDASATLYARLDAGPGADAPLTSCFVPDGTTAADGAAVVVVPADPQRSTPETVVLGSSRALTNGAITTEAHAALALRALGPTPRLVWYVPSSNDLTAPGPDGAPVEDPSRGVPPWFAPAALLLAFVVVALALARGRRLGRLVTEPLPVVVRAVETTEARGRLYHRAADRPVAAAALRSGTATRLTERLGLARGTTTAALVDAVARATDRPRSDVEHLLDGPSPTTDPDLLLLAQRLADLEESVRSA